MVWAGIPPALAIFRKTKRKGGIFNLMDQKTIKPAHPHEHLNNVHKTYAALLLITACCFALEYAPQPMYNTISRVYGTSHGVTVLLVSVYMLSLSVAPLFVGILLDRFGIRRAILAATALLGASAAGIALASSFPVLLATRCFQALLAPVILTAVLTAIASLFRHLHQGQALAGYIAATLTGALTGRLAGGWGADCFGWRETIIFFCLLFLPALPLLRKMPEIQRSSSSAQPHLSDYLRLLRQPGIGAVVLAEACGLFIFAAVGNLIPFRMAELGKGDSSALIGLMYTGYAIGLVATLILEPLKRLLKSNGRLLLAAAFFYVLSVTALSRPSVTVLVAGIWGMAFGQFVVHAMSPGLINMFAAQGEGGCNRAMANGLFLSCTYLGGLLGSWLPAEIYSRCGWTTCYVCLQATVALLFAVVLKLVLTRPELR